MPEIDILKFIDKKSDSKSAALQSFGGKLKRLFDDAHTKKQTIEQRMLESNRLYEGDYDIETQGILKSNRGSKIFGNITRNKTIGGAARVSDIVLPSDGTRNFSVGTTPVISDPEEKFDLKEDQILNKIKDLGQKGRIEEFDTIEAKREKEERSQDRQQRQDLQQDNGQEEEDLGEELSQDQAVLNDEEKKELSDDDKAERMENLIWDQFVEADYQAAMRKALTDAAKLGTGIIKGPFPEGRAKQKWETAVDEDGKSVSILKIVKEIKPSFEVISPFDYFPDMSAMKKQDAEFEFDRKFIPRKGLRELARQPAYDAEQIARVLEEEPDTSRDNSREERRRVAGTTTSNEQNNYELVTYYGPVSKRELAAAGFFDGELSSKKEKILESELFELEGVVMFVNGVVIRATVNPFEGQGSPYKVIPWDKQEGSVFGNSIPWNMRDSQAMVSSSIRMIMDNGGLSTGPQIVYKKGVVQPANGINVIEARKIWEFIGDEDVDVRTAFNVFDIPNNQTELLNIFNLGLQMADIESNLPLSAMGENTPTPTDTATGELLRQNTINIILRRVVKSFDDEITKPLVRDFYSYNMQYSEDNNIKGDFCVHAKGSSSLINRENEKQATLVALQFALSNPELNLETDIASLWKNWMMLEGINTDDALRTEQEKAELQQQAQEAAQSQQQDPAALAKAQNDANQFQLDQQELALKAEGQQFDQQIEIEKLRIKEQEATSDLQFQIAKASSQENVKFNEMAEAARQAAEDLALKAQSESERNKTARDSTAVKANLEASKQELQAENLRQGKDTF